MEGPFAEAKGETVRASRRALVGESGGRVALKTLGAFAECGHCVQAFCRGIFGPVAFVFSTQTQHNQQYNKDERGTLL